MRPAPTGTPWHTAHYRAGDWTAAVAALEKSMTVGNGGDGFEWFFLAMAHRQLGHEDEARSGTTGPWSGWTRTSQRTRRLLRFRAEASELMGIEPKTP